MSGPNQSRRSSAAGVILENRLEITRLNTHVTRSGRVFTICVALTIVTVIVGLVLKFFTDDQETQIDLRPSTLCFISSGAPGGSALGAGGVYGCSKRKVTYLSNLAGSSENTHLPFQFAPSLVTDLPDPAKSPQPTPENRPISGAREPLLTPSGHERRLGDQSV
jgi:hypothetical protein